MERHKEDNIVSAEKRQQFGINSVGPRNIPFPTIPMFVLVWLLWRTASSPESRRRLVYTTYRNLTCESAVRRNSRLTDTEFSEFFL